MTTITIPLNPEARQALASDMQEFARHKAEMERAMLVIRSRAEIMLQEQGRPERVPLAASFALTEDGLVITGGPSPMPAPAPVNREQRRANGKRREPVVAGANGHAPGGEG